MRAVLKFFWTILLIVVLMVALEQLCYRFSEAYAAWRADWTFENKDSAGFFPSIVMHLPLNQLANPPVGENNVSNERVSKAESLYAERMLSHTRPLRDVLYEHFLQRGTGLGEFEVREVAGIKDMVLPGLTSLATLEDVEEGIARRVGEKIPFAKAVFLSVLSSKHEISKGEFDDRRRELETQFVPFLERGIGCGIVHASNAADLVNIVENLCKKEKKLAGRVLAWGQGISASHLAKAISMKPNLWTGVVMESPDPQSFMTISPPDSGPWVLTLLSLNDQDRNGDLWGKMIEWARAGRRGTLPLASRMGGLFHLSIPDPERSAEDQAFGDAFLLECVKRTHQLDSSVEKELLSVNPPSSLGEQKENFFKEADKPISDKVPIEDFSSRENTPSSSLASLHKPTYDCEVLRDYRALKPELQNVDNKTLILKLGRGFENNGLIEEIRKRDEFFVLYYESLRALVPPP